MYDSNPHIIFFGETQKYDLYIKIEREKIVTQCWNLKRPKVYVIFSVGVFK